MRPTDRSLLDRWNQNADAEAFAELVARHGSMVASVCRRIVRDAQLADDVTQECFLRLARSGSAPASNLGAWLHRVATNRSLNALRKLRSLPETAEDLEPTDSGGEELAAWRELEPHIDAAIADLPDELRTVVIGHFLEGRSHRELARELRLGFRTVGNRIHKGVEQLRRALAARGITVSRDALATALLTPPKGPVPLACHATLGRIALAGPEPIIDTNGAVWAGFAASGSTKTVMVLAAGMLALLLAALWFTPGPERAGPVSVGAGAPSRIAAVDRSLDTPAAGLDRSIVSVPRPAAKTAQIFCRCVDTQGMPLAAVPVALGNRPGRAADSHRLEHGPLDVPPTTRTTTDQDGRFCFTVARSLPLEFDLEITPADRGALRAGLPTWSSDSALDLGDIELPSGTRIHGRVVDRSGLAVDGARIVLGGAVGISFGRPLPRRFGDVEFHVDIGTFSSCDRQGFFRFDRRVPPETLVRIEVPGYRVLEPAHAVPVPATDLDLRVVVEKLPTPTDRPRIEGIVRAADGSPIPGARIHPRAAHPFDMALYQDAALSGRDGAFTLLNRRELAGAPTRLHVHAPGYQSWHSDAAIDWQTSGVTITLDPGPFLGIEVRRAVDKAPVERYGIVLAPVRPDGSEWGNNELQFVADHPGGILRVPHVTPGSYRLTVRPPGSSGLAASEPTEIDVTAGEPNEVCIELGTPESLAVASPARGIETPPESAEPQLNGIEVRLEVRIDGTGRPTQVTFEQDPTPRQRVPTRVVVATDSAGNASTRLTPGTWRSRLLYQRRGPWVEVRGPEIQVGAGTPRVFYLHACTGSRRVQILRPDGAPAAGLQLGGLSCGVTDAEGRTELIGAVGLAHPIVQREPLLHPTVLLDWIRAHPGVIPSLRLEPVVLLAGESDEVILQLPPAWHRLPD